MGAAIKWTGAMDAKLIHAYRSNTNEGVAKVLGISLNSVYRRLKYLRDNGFSLVKDLPVTGKKLRRPVKEEQVIVIPRIDMTNKVAVKLGSRTWVMRDKSKVGI